MFVKNWNKPCAFPLKTAYGNKVYCVKTLTGPFKFFHTYVCILYFNFDTSENTWNFEVKFWKHVRIGAHYHLLMKKKRITFYICFTVSAVLNHHIFHLYPHKVSSKHVGCAVLVKLVWICHGHRAYYNSHSVYKKVKQFHNTPMEAQGGEEIWLLIIHDLGTR
jgi:hypothetical protein